MSREKAHKTQKLLWLWILRGFTAIHWRCGNQSESNQIKPPEQSDRQLGRGIGEGRSGQTESNQSRVGLLGGYDYDKE
jgi:hypothetical protein